MSDLPGLNKPISYPDFTADPAEMNTPVRTKEQKVSDFKATAERQEVVKESELVKEYMDKILKINAFTLLSYLIQSKSILNIPESFFTETTVENLANQIRKLPSLLDINDFAKIIDHFIVKGEYGLVGRGALGRISEEEKQLFTKAAGVERYLETLDEKFKSNNIYNELKTRIIQLQDRLSSDAGEKDLTGNEIADYQKQIDSIRSEFDTLKQSFQNDEALLREFREHPVEDAEVKSQIDEIVFNFSGKHLQDFAVINLTDVGTSLKDETLLSIAKKEIKGTFMMSYSLLQFTLDGKTLYKIPFENSQFSEIRESIKKLNLDGTAYMPLLYPAAAEKMREYISELEVQDAMEVLEFFSSAITPKRPIANFLVQEMKILNLENLMFYFRKVNERFSENLVQEYLDSQEANERNLISERVSKIRKYVDTLVTFVEENDLSELSKKLNLYPGDITDFESKVNKSIGLGNQSLIANPTDLILTLKFHSTRNILFNKYIFLLLERTMNNIVTRNNGSDFNLHTNYVRLFNLIEQEFANNDIMLSELQRVKKSYIKTKKSFSSSLPREFDEAA